MNKKYASGKKKNAVSTLRNPMLYLASVISSFIFAFGESFIGLFNFHLTINEVVEIVTLSIVGIFASMVIFGILNDAWQKK